MEQLNFRTGPFDENEDKCIRYNAGKKPVQLIAAILRRKKQSVYDRMVLLGLKTKAEQ